MKKIATTSLDYYNKCVIKRIMNKYGLDEIKATKEFLTSETHQLLENADMAMWEFPELGIFEIWEAEKITGDPRNSIYLRSEEN